jgi:oxepin-CoA hydrolase/3-oxo-5,6-dehydrosuberyl-CoA semialdehyde dehydrogenase
MFITLKKDAPTLIGRLQAETPPLWGLMSAQHMLEHLYLVLRMGSGKLLNIPIVTPPEKIPKRQDFLMSEVPMPREFKAPLLPKEGVLPLEFPDIATAKQALIQEIEDFYAYFEAHPQAELPHPVFGMLDFEKWEMMQRKHFTHHFTQFGMLPA